MIITKSISRFSRNTLDCINYVRMLKGLPNPVEIYFEKENISTLDEKSELLLTILSTLAQEEARNVSENVKWGTRKLAQRGIYNMPAHRYFGFDSDKQGNWIINDEQATVVRKIYADYLQGKSPKAIAKGLSENGVMSPSGNTSWNPLTVQYILQNEKNCGSVLYQKYYSKDFITKKQVKNLGELPQYLIEDHHPAIVEPKIYEAVQQEFEHRKRGVKTTKKHPNQDAFFKMFYCGKCGSLMSHYSILKRSKEKQTVYHYWRCRVSSGVDFSTTCDARGYREEIIEHTFMIMLYEMKEHPQLIFETKQAIQEAGLSGDEQRQMEKLRNEMKEHYQHLYEIVKANREREDFDINSYEIKSVTDKIITIEKEIEVYNGRLEKAKLLQEELDWLLEELGNLKKYNPNKKGAFRADIFSRLIKRGEVYEDGKDGKIVYDLTLGIKWTAYGINESLPKAEVKKTKK